MSSTQINTIQTTTSVKTNFETEKLTPIALPQNSDDDASKNDKKSKGCLFNKVQTTSPKLQSSYDINKMTTQELIALYGKLPPSERSSLIKEIFENNPNRLNDVYQNLPSSSKNQFVADELKALSPIFVEMFNKASPDIKAQGSKEFLSQIASILNTLPKDEKDEFLSKFKKSLNSILKNKKNLSSSDKKDIKDFINQINSYQKGNISTSDLLDVKSKEILNIMMIMVKAFCNSMNTESLDMLSQIDQISTNNMFLNIAQTKLEKDGTKIAQLGNVAARGWIFILVSIAVIAVVIVASIFLGPAGEDIFVKTTPELGAEDSANVLDNSAGKLENENTDIDETEVNENPTPEKPSDVNPKEGQSESTQGVKEDVEKFEKVEGGGSSDDTTRSAEQKKNIKQQQNSEDETKKGNNEKQVKKPEKVKWNEELWKKAGNKIEKNWKDGVKNGILYGGFATLSLFGVLKSISPSSVNLRFPFLTSKALPAQPNAVDLALTQNDSSVETTITDTLNNSTQTSSKFIDNDSQKQNQYAGDVQQAINMLGQAYTGQ